MPLENFGLQRFTHYYIPKQKRLFCLTALYEWKDESIKFELVEIKDSKLGESAYVSEPTLELFKEMLSDGRMKKVNIGII